jgi:hypothetical protein
MRYMLLFCGSEEDRRAFEAMSEDELRARYGEVAAWFAANDERIRSTAQLQPREAATTVRFPREGEPLVTDGPFLVGREDIGGYATIEVADLDAALAMARSWPGRGCVEIRPLPER